MEDAIVVAGFARTPLGAMQGVFKDVPATRLGGVAIRAALADAGIAPEDVNEVIMGCLLSSGLGQAPARQAAFAADIPHHVSACVVNKVCGSGLKSIINASHTLNAGYADIMVAGAMESVSRAPYLLDRARKGYRLGHAEIYDVIFLDALQDAFSGNQVGHFAEQTAEKFGISRSMQDAFTEESLLRARKAMEEGRFKREIAPVVIKEREGDCVVQTDEHPFRASLDTISQLRPAFKKDGTVTTANAGAIADGAAAFVLMRESEALQRGVKPQARIVGFAEHGQAPEWNTTASVPAVEKLLQRTGWRIDDVDLFEINEAFAAVTLNAIQQLQIDHSKVNIHGGACALGHPLGATGARMLTTLISALQAHHKKRGVAALCVGGGEGIAMGVELV